MTLPGPRPTPVLIDSVRVADGAVDVLDRRRYPNETTWVRCHDVDAVADAIREMVTQSSGPRFAATAGLVLAARQVRDHRPDEVRVELHRAAAVLVATRPTNNHIRDAADAVIAAVEAAGPDASSVDLADAVEAAAAAHDAQYRQLSTDLGSQTAALLPDGARVLTHCWADHFLVATVQAAAAAGKELSFTCTETRPYLQGARLTAAALVEMGYTPTVITDGMVAAAMVAGRVDVLLTAADRVTLDGHVINKVGTLMAALAARHAGVPYHAMIDAPDLLAPTVDDVELEERDGDEVLHVGGLRTAAALTRGWYPAFDVTPPSLITRIVTSRGAFAPQHVGRHFAGCPVAGQVP
jgi:methylthioribose-1-phosphate isomerase